MEKINNCIEIKNKIQTVIKFYQYFYQKDYKKVENIENLNLKLSGEKIKNFSKYKEEIDLVLKDFDESIKYNNLANSKFFIAIHSFIKNQENQTDDKSIKDSFSIFQTLINLLDENTLTKIDRHILNLILHSIQDEKSLHNEIK